MIDTHAHYNSSDLKNLQAEIELIDKSDLTAIINVGLDLKSSKECIDISNINNKFFNQI